MNVVVIGAGIYGLAVAHALLRDGHRITLVEQGPVPNPLSSSYDDQRLHRVAYGRDRAYADMAEAALPAWERLWEQLGQSFYRKTGLLTVGTEAGRDWMESSAAWLQERGHGVETLPDSALGARFPVIRPNLFTSAVAMPDAGLLQAAALLQRLAEAIADHPRAQVLSGSRVARVLPQIGSIVTEDGDTISADHVLICCGAWAARLVPQMQQRLIPSRQVVAYVRPDSAMAEVWASMPPISTIEGDQYVYAFPCGDGQRVKIGWWRLLLEGDPDGDRSAGQAELSQMLGEARKRLLGLDAAAVDSARTGFFTLTEDRRMLLEPLSDRMTLLNACSGHGFKFAALLAEKLCDGLSGRIPMKALSAYIAGTAPLPEEQAATPTRRAVG